MRQVRLLPIVVLATSALLGLKAIGLVSGTGYTLGGLGAVVAQEAEGQGVDTQESDTQQDDLAAAEAAAEALFNSAPDQSDDLQDINLREISGSGQETPIVSEESETADVLVQRLGERRAELDAFAEEIETRLAVVEAAELRIEERMAELNALEAEINATLDAQEAEEAEEFAAIVAMYENMRAGDAGTIFNDLDMSVLVRLGKAMNPRKLGPIMAKMTPAKAQELTVHLARNEDEVPAAAMADTSELPQIIGQ